MPNFGISAFLRIVHLNERPQRTELRRRARPTKGGYDFHASSRRLAHRLLVDEEGLQDVVASAMAIANVPERLSALRALQRLNEWRLANDGPILAFNPVTYQSPSQTFKVTFTPTFGLRIGSQTVAVHVWNTVSPQLSPTLVRAVLSLFVEPYGRSDSGPDDLAILCLRTMRLMQLGGVAEAIELGRLISRNIDCIFQDIVGQADERQDGPSDQPPAPPPAES